MNGKFNIDQLKLESIKIINASIVNQLDLQEVPKSDFSRTMSFKFNFAVSRESKQAKVNFLVVLKAKNKIDTDIRVEGTYEISYIFFVENIDELSSPGEGEHVELSQDLIIAMANIAYSTSRGIIYTRCLGTVLNDVILPIMPNSEFERIFIKGYKAKNELTK
ncbi:hypothetical protein [Flavihumibacter sp. CACIAM 22H1]|uniref:hypothetical protein n=1 Tax=Flavihumibacter sp. CACIAM 22H1 TaxID=1812911 RepID=UPI0007A7CC6D|nr:hypothetical protein [Flavihumibacter sp. CACIAM 22H1]KYP16638.1 MAG: hypothetical protein A1D16_09510 [Flavihumibacter sp. CACIAM 22H1]